MIPFLMPLLIFSVSHGGSDLKLGNPKSWIGEKEAKIRSLLEESGSFSFDGSVLAGGTGTLVYNVENSKKARPQYYWVTSSKVKNIISGVFVIPKLNKNEWFISYNCTGLTDQSVIAVVDSKQNHERLPALRAWRVEVDSGKFHSVPVKGISCRNEGFGV